MMKSRSHRTSGQSLVELLVAIAIGIILLLGAVLMISASTKTNADISRRQIAAGFARGLIDNVRIFAESKWGNIAGLTPGLGIPYFISATSSPFLVMPGIESVVFASTTYTRYFYVEPVNRNSAGGIDISGTIDDPSTKRVTVVYGYGAYPTSTLVTYLTRWRSSVFRQTDWSAGSGESSTFSMAISRFSTSTNITATLLPGSLYVDTVPIPQQKYLKFNGIVDYVALPNNIFDSLTEGTVEAWVRAGNTTNPQGNSTLVWFYAGDDNDGCSNAFSCLELEIVNGKFGVRIQEAGGADPEFSGTANSDPLGASWHHLAFTVSAASGNQFYIDGVPQTVSYGGSGGGAASTMFFSDVLSGGSAYAIGGNPSYLAEDFLGDIDDVRVWNRALSQAEIVNGLYEELLGSESGLVGYWNFNEGAAQAALDASIGNHVGMLGSLPTADPNDPRWMPTPPEPITIGETTILPDGDSGNANLLIAQQATLVDAATIQSLSFHIVSAAGNLRLGIYDATGPGGGPGAKMAETAEFTPGTGWNTANVTTPVLLVPGVYWLAYLPSNDGLEFRKTIPSDVDSVYYSFAYGTMPNTFSTSPTPTPAHWSFYATLIPE